MPIDILGMLGRLILKKQVESMLCDSCHITFLNPPNYDSCENCNARICTTCQYKIDIAAMERKKKGGSDDKICPVCQGVFY